MPLLYDDEQPKKLVFDSPGEEPSLASGLASDAKDLYNVGARTVKGIAGLPADIGSSTRGMMEGQPFSETPLGQDVSTVESAVKNAVPRVVTSPSQVGQYGRFDPGWRIEPGAISRQYEDLAAQGMKMIPGKVGKIFKEQYPGNPLREHPLNSALALAPVAAPLFKVARSIPAVDEGMNAIGRSIRENVTAPTARRALGLSKASLNKLDTQLPQANEAALTAVDKGVIRNPITHPFSSNAESMFQRAQALDRGTGADIGSYLDSVGQKLDWRKTLDDLDSVKRQFPDDPDMVGRIDNAKAIVERTAIRNGGSLSAQEMNDIKSYIQNKTPWNSDKTSAEIAQKAAGTVRGSLDTQLEDIAKKESSSPEFGRFKENKKLFGKTKIMEKGLLNKRAGESGNLPVSPYSVAVGVGEMMHGGSLKGFAAALGAEWVKRFGSATAATMSNNVSQLFLSNPAKYDALIKSIGSTGATLPVIEKALQNDPDFTKAIQIPNKKAASLIKKKPLDDDTAMAMLQEANDDPKMARKLARERGYEVV